jgi:RecB family exonuclease
MPASGTLRAAEMLARLAGELAPLTSPSPLSVHLGRLLLFLRKHETLPDRDDPSCHRQLRARAAILTILTSLHEVYERFDQASVTLAHMRALVRRWIEAHTFAPRTGRSGVHLVDCDSARFGDFDYVQLAGLVDGEWPERPRRNIFYSAVILRELGWPSEGDRLAAAKDAFADLLRLASTHVAVSSFLLEGDAIVSPSDLIDSLGAEPHQLQEPVSGARVFEHEALVMDPVDTTFLGALRAKWAWRRLEDRERHAREPGTTAGHFAPAFAVSALERYQDCPFKFFAEDVLRLKASPADELAPSSRERGRLVHEVLHRFFNEWDREGPRRITADRAAAARAVFEGIAGAMLERLPTAEAAIERARLLGSAVSVGIVDLVIDHEVGRSERVSDRWLEYRLDGEYGLGLPDGRRVCLKGVADRIDLLDGRRLRVIDYKSGRPPAVKRALQVPIYGLCAQERLSERDQQPWSIDEAEYLAFSGRRTSVPVIREGTDDSGPILDAARNRLLTALDGIARGDFPPSPHDPVICGYCEYPAVCRKDYVGDV